jgi:hypothetical protein
MGILSSLGAVRLTVGRTGPRLGVSEQVPKLAIRGHEHLGDSRGLRQSPQLAGSDRQRGDQGSRPS